MLCSPGVYFLQDPNSNVYNFDPQLEKIVPTADFDFSALPSYKTSSEDKALLNVMREHNTRFSGSTSSLTGLLQHLHFLISNWRPLDCSSMSRRFGKVNDGPTPVHKLPAAVFFVDHLGFALQASSSCIRHCSHMCQRLPSLVCQVYLPP